jgi:acyl carrier protein
LDEHPLLPLLREIVLAVTEKPVTDISPTDAISELGIDSISVAEILVRIEDALAIEIPAIQWLQVRTLQEMLELMDQNRPTLSSVSATASTRTNPSHSS